MTRAREVSKLITATGDVGIADKIVHTGDTNTAIRFSANDTFTVETAGSERLRIESDGNVKAKVGTQYKGFTLVKGNGGTVAQLVGHGSDNDEGGLNLWDGNVKKVQILANGTSYSNGGNFGVGTDNPLRTLDVNGIALIGRPSTFWATSPDFYGINNLGSLGSQGSYAVDLTSNGYRNTSGTWTSLGINGETGAAKVRLNPAGSIEFKTDSNKASGSSVSPTLRMRLDSGGNLALSTSANNNPVSNNVVGVALRTAGNIITNMMSVNAPHQFRRNNDGDIIRFYRNSTTDCGAIRVTSGTTHFDTSSDYRLKENMVAITDGIDRVKQLQPKRFNFIEFPENTVDGFIAHEAQAVVPEAISGVKDGTEEQEYEVTPAVVDEEGNLTKEAVMGTHTVPKYQAIDQSKLVPLLTAALQEAIGEIETLKQRLSDAGIA